MEKTSDFICSHCEFPIFPEMDTPVSVILSPFCALFFCDLICAKHFMESLTQDEVDQIMESFGI